MILNSCSKRSALFTKTRIKLSRGNWTTCLLFFYGRTNHLAKDCFYKKTEPPKLRKGAPPTLKFLVNMLTSNSTKTVCRSILFTPEVNLTLPVNDWWIGTRANIHVCSDQLLFFIYQVSVEKLWLWGTMLWPMFSE